MEDKTAETSFGYEEGAGLPQEPVFDIIRS
jgi:hypothetical protein